MSSSLKPYPTNFKAQLIRIIISCKWALTNINDIEFLRLIMCLDPDRKLPSLSTVTNRVLKLRETSENSITARLPKVPQKVAIVLDGWSVLRRDRFLVIKAY